VGEEKSRRKKGETGKTIILNYRKKNIPILFPKREKKEEKENTVV